MWEVLFNLDKLSGYGIDALVYLGLALVGTLLFGLRLALSLFGFDHGDGDFASGIDAHAGDGFGLLSLLSITAFFMGTGWAGLAARIEWGLGGGAAAAAAIAVGFGMMGLASGLMYGARRLASEKSYDVATAVGKPATAYVTIPAKGQGAGQVRVSVSGRSMIIKAVSAGPAIEAFKDVKVTAARDAETLVVEPLEG